MGAYKQGELFNFVQADKVCARGRAVEVAIRERVGISW